MHEPTLRTDDEAEPLDRYYREWGLRAMASPVVHYDEGRCPHAGCGHRMEWIDFKRDRPQQPEAIDHSLVRSWWEGTGFVGRCPGCRGWIRFTTMKMEAISEEEAAKSPALPDDWSQVAQIA